MSSAVRHFNIQAAMPVWICLWVSVRECRILILHDGSQSSFQHCRKNRQHFGIHNLQLMLVNKSLQETEQVEILLEVYRTDVSAKKDCEAYCPYRWGVPPTLQPLLDNDEAAVLVSKFTDVAAAVDNKKTCKDLGTKNDDSWIALCEKVQQPLDKLEQVEYLWDGTDLVSDGPSELLEVQHIGMVAKNFGIHLKDAYANLGS